MKCYKCGAEMVEDAVFCGICGTRLKEVPTEMAEKSIEAEASEWDVAEEWEPAEDWDEKEEWETLNAEDDSAAEPGSTDARKESAGLIGKTHCPNCGKQLAEGMAFCNECGCRISDGVKVQKEKKDQKTMIPVLVIGAAVIVAAVIVLFFIL